VKKQVLVAAVAMALVAFLFIAGKTSIGKKNTDTGAKKAKQTFNIQLVIKDLAAKLDPQKIEYLAKLENSVKRGDVKTQQIEAFEQLANFWKDSVSAFEPYAFYISEAAQLDNSEKKLTFAAQLFLGRLRQEHDTEKLGWQTQQAILLFNKALQLNPANADLKIGLGSAYVFGSQSGDAQQTMQGIQQLLSVVREDSNNMKAQFVLGVGSAVSGQYNKAIERFTKVVTAEPTNVEAIAFLADTYAATGNKSEAVKWYNVSKKLVNNSSYSKEVDKRIELLNTR